MVETNGNFKRTISILSNIDMPYIKRDYMPGLIDVQANVQTRAILPLKGSHNLSRAIYQSFLTNPNQNNGVRKEASQVPACPIPLTLT